MRCDKCGLEAVIDRAERLADGRRELVFVCRNRQCPSYRREVGRMVPERKAQK